MLLRPSSREPIEEATDGLYESPAEHESWTTCCSLSSSSDPTGLFGLSDTEDPEVPPSPARHPQGVVAGQRG